MLSQFLNKTLTARRAAKYAPFLMHHRPDALAPVEAVAPGESADDRELVERIVTAYRRAARDLRIESSSLWGTIFRDHFEETHETLMGGDVERVAAILRDPAASSVFYGIDGLVSSRRMFDPHSGSLPLFVLDDLLRFAEAIGAMRLDNPEAYLAPAARRHTVEEVVSRIEATLGARLCFPNPFPHERGIRSPRGVISMRAVQALYQAWRVEGLLAECASSRVLEIGAGLGRTAYYARQFGVVDYTIIDLPSTSVAQAYFLGRTVGPSAVLLYGEEAPATTDKIKILPPPSFMDGDDDFDVVLNVDSMPEMGKRDAEAYWRQIVARASVFLSINHEANDFSVRELIGETSGVIPVDRFPYWMRRGYVEEIVRLSAAS